MAQKPEVMEDTPVELLKGGAALVKSDNDSMSVVAVQRPRNEEAILTGALAELDMLKGYAERTYYSLPFKNHVQGCRNRKKCDCPTDWVRGISIKGAMNLARRWGNCSTSVRVIDEDEDGLILEGVFLDLESNFRCSKPRAVSKWVEWSGERKKMYDDRYEKLVASNTSKILRNVILDALPDWLTQSYYDRAREIAIAESDKDNGREPHKKILSAFALLGVERVALETLIGNKLEEVTDEQRKNLFGVLNAIKAKEETVESIFGAKPASDTASDGKKADTMEKSKARMEGGTRKGDKPEPEGDAENEPPVCVECSIPEADHEKNSADHLFVAAVPKTEEADKESDGQSELDLNKVK